MPDANDTQPNDKESYIKMYAVNMIKRFSHYSNKDEIMHYVSENYTGDNATCFISGNEVDLIHVIYQGIGYFTYKRPESKKKAMN
jgi:hypothetical protein